MTQPPGDSPRPGNPGVTAGCLLLVACFLLPWVSLVGLSGFQIAYRGDAAEAAFAVLGLSHPSPLSVTRLLLFIPALAITTWMLNATAPAKRWARLAAKLAVALSALAFTAFFAGFGLLFGASVTVGFWGSLMGSLFILVGVIFDVARND